MAPTSVRRTTLACHIHLACPIWTLTDVYYLGGSPVGFLIGGVNYSDFELVDDRFSSTFKRDFAYGLQTSVDLSPESWTHWGFNLGVKYLNSSAEFEGAAGEVKVDPLIWRAMLVYKW